MRIQLPLKPFMWYYTAFAHVRVFESLAVYVRQDQSRGGHVWDLQNLLTHDILYSTKNESEMIFKVFSIAVQKVERERIADRNG